MASISALAQRRAQAIDRLSAAMGIIGADVPTPTIPIRGHDTFTMQVQQLERIADWAEAVAARLSPAAAPAEPPANVNPTDPAEPGTDAETTEGNDGETGEPPADVADGKTPPADEAPEPAAPAAVEPPVADEDTQPLTTGKKKR